MDWNKLRALLSGKMFQTVECTNNIDVDLVCECWLWCYDDIRRYNLRSKLGQKLGSVFNKGHHWEKFRKVRN